MASRAVLLLLLQTLLLAMALMDSVSGEGAGGVSGEENGWAALIPADTKSSFVSRRLTGTEREMGRGFVSLPCSILNCGFWFPVTFPTCCLNSVTNANNCVNTQASDLYNCGGCNNRCNVGEVCCKDKCANLLTDVNNCGVCGFKCPKHDNKCSWGLCNYNGQEHGI